MWESRHLASTGWSKLPLSCRIIHPKRINPEAILVCIESIGWEVTRSDEAANSEKWKSIKDREETSTQISSDFWHSQDTKPVNHHQSTIPWLNAFPAPPKSHVPVVQRVHVPTSTWVPSQYLPPLEWSSPQSAASPAWALLLWPHQRFHCPAAAQNHRPAECWESWW